MIIEPKIIQFETTIFRVFQLFFSRFPLFPRIYDIIFCISSVPSRISPGHASEFCGEIVLCFRKFAVSSCPKCNLPCNGFRFEGTIQNPVSSNFLTSWPYKRAKNNYPSGNLQARALFLPIGKETEYTREHFKNPKNEKLKFYLLVVSFPRKIPS